MNFIRPRQASTTDQHAPGTPGTPGPIGTPGTAAMGMTASLAEARMALDAGLVDRAARILEHALVDHPGHTEAIMALATARLAQGRASDAVKLLDRHDLYHPSRREEPAIALLRTTALAAAGEVEAAGAWSERLARQFPDDTRARRSAAALAGANGQRGTAVTHLQSALRLAPGDRDARVALAVEQEANDPDAAIAALTGDKKLMEDAATCRWVARLCRSAKRLREAEEWLRRATTIDENERTAWREMALLADEAGAIDAAITRYGEALSAGSGQADVRAMEGLALALMHSGRFGPAARAWLRVRRAGGDEGRALAGIAVCALAAMGLNEEMKPDHEGTGLKREARVSGPERLAPSVRLARRSRLVRRAMARMDGMMSGAERREAIARLWPEAAMGMAVTHALASEEIRPEGTGLGSEETIVGGDGQRAVDASVLMPMLSRARAALLQATESRPEHADKWHHLAVCEEKLGDKAAARRASERALALNPRFAVAARLVEKLEKRAA